MSVTIEKPGSPVRRPRKGINWEKWGWIYMRVSGIVLVVLIFGHLFVNLMVGEGVKAIGTLTIYAFDPCPAGSPAELLPSFCPAV
jgi:succinate dehydrogenase/fumarate reductase cytochrome b subunit